jgi:hypothetical protein
VIVGPVPTGKKNPKYKGTGEMPGDARNARQINEPGPVRDQP